MDAKPDVALAPSSPFVPTPRRVLRVRRETHDTVTLTLEGAGFSFRPGQFNMLYAFAVGEVPISMSGDPVRDGEIVHTIRNVGPASGALARIKRGAAIGVRGPFGQPWPLDRLTGMDLVIVAGGLGLAPLRPAVYHVLRHRRAYGRVSVLVGARSPAELLYPRELERWKRRGNLRVLTIVDHSGPEWKGRIGVVTALLEGLPIDSSRTAAFVCGPELMMRFTIRELARAGVSDARMYVSLERNMKCAVGLCGRCQYGPSFVCKDGPVLPFERIRPLFFVPEV